MQVWHKQAWQQVAAQWDKLPHAWLLTGREGTGKAEFARYFAQALLCEQPLAEHAPCGECASCRLFEAGTHPDFYDLAADLQADETAVSARKLLQIKIDAVRAVLEPLNQSSVRGGRRVVLVSPAEAMNVQAANALLKILEEPPQAVVFLLVSHNRDRLLPTIKSRCRKMLLPAPTLQQALDYLHAQGVANAAEILAFHGGAPLFESDDTLVQMRGELLTLLMSPRLLAVLDFAAAFDKLKQPLAVLLDWLQKWLIDVGLCQQGLPPLYYPAHAQALAAAAQKLPAQALFKLHDDIMRLAPYGHHTLNVRMQAEYLLGNYLTAFNRR